MGRLKALCKCGHTGNTTNSEHYATVEPGHGACKVPGCDCKKFTWTRFVE